MKGIATRFCCSIFLLMFGAVACMVLTLVMLVKPTGAAPYRGVSSQGSAMAGSVAQLGVERVANQVQVEAVSLVTYLPDAPFSKQARGRFFQGWKRLDVPDAGCKVVIAGDPSGQAPFRADDRLTLTAHLTDGRARTWMYDFRKGGQVAYLTPTEVQGVLGSDLRFLEVALDDLVAPTFGNSDIWLLPCANVALLYEASPTATSPATATAVHTSTPTSTHTATTAPTEAQESLPTPTWTPVMGGLVGGIATPSPISSNRATPTTAAASLTAIAGIAGTSGDNSTPEPLPLDSWWLWAIGAGGLCAVAGLVLVLLGRRGSSGGGAGGGGKGGAVEALHMLRVYDQATGELLQSSIAGLPAGISRLPLRISQDLDEAEYVVTDPATGGVDSPYQQASLAPSLSEYGLGYGTGDDFGSVATQGRKQATVVYKGRGEDGGEGGSRLLQVVLDGRHLAVS